MTNPKNPSKPPDEWDTTGSGWIWLTELVPMLDAEIARKRQEGKGRGK